MNVVEHRSKILSALAHPLRLQLVESLLEGGMQNVTMLIETVGRSQALVSKHLRVLRDAGVVRCTPDGRCRGYEVTSPEALTALIAVIERLESEHPSGETSHDHPDHC